jgi:hypothetical protein
MPRVYHIWGSIIDRCRKPTHNLFHIYGGRGITCSDSWVGKNGLAQFIADIGEPPSDRHIVLRRNMDGPYDKDNCYWGTRKALAHRVRLPTGHPFSITYLTAFGETLSISEWSRRVGTDRRTLRRYLEQGMPPEEALTRPVPLRGTSFPPRSRPAR